MLKSPNFPLKNVEPLTVIHFLFGLQAIKQKNKKKVKLGRLAEVVLDNTEARRSSSGINKVQ